MRRPKYSSNLLLACALTAGCRHTPVIPSLPPQKQTPEMFVQAPTLPALPAMQQPLPEGLADAVTPVTVEEAKPRRHRRSGTGANAQVQVEETPATAGAAAAPTADAALGSLSPGEDSGAAQGQAAAGIADVEKRLMEAPKAAQQRHPRQVSQVRLFLKQATNALKMGDAQGATNLATKAGLLLDDMQK